jgi:hypothetical protein
MAVTAWRRTPALAKVGLSYFRFILALLAISNRMQPKLDQAGGFGNQETADQSGPVVVFAVTA